MVNLTAKASDEEGRCPRCNANLSIKLGRYATKGNRCPMCGYPLDRPKDIDDKVKPSGRW